MNQDSATGLLELLAVELKRGGVTEAAIISNGSHVHGLCDDQQVIVNPAPAIVEILLHELLHRRFPRWGERRVHRTAERLIYYMDTAAVRSWHRKYKRAARKRARPIFCED